MVITRLGARTRSARLKILSFSGVAPPSAWRPALISPALGLSAAFAALAARNRYEKRAWWAASSLDVGRFEVVAVSSKTQPGSGFSGVFYNLVRGFLSGFSGVFSLCFL